jgi:hypothetical protein
VRRVLAETCYWLNEHGGAELEAAFLDAAAERLGVREIATLDRRHFPAITPKDGGHFTQLPESL